ncbi:MAG: hypothetical protein QOI09_2392, partial [Chloroflexota bacterium]|nr:hypothetical protein [Chloroflexota bacterium]
MSTAPSRSPFRTRLPELRSARGWNTPTAGDVATTRWSSLPPSPGRWRAGDPAAARRELDASRAAAKESNPQFALERQLLAVQQGRVQGNVKELIEALDVRHPQGEFILEALAMGCVQNYELNRAAFWIDLLLTEWNPRNAVCRLLRAETTDTQGDREKAIGQLQELAAEY